MKRHPCEDTRNDPGEIPQALLGPSPQNILLHERSLNALGMCVACMPGTKKNRFPAISSISSYWDISTRESPFALRHARSAHTEAALPLEHNCQ